MHAIDERTTVSLAELADALSETPERLQAFIDAQVIRPNDRGEFPLMLSVASYVAFWRSVADAADARKLARKAC
jgi:hypothetical protein